MRRLAKRQTLTPPSPTSIDIVTLSLRSSGLVCIRIFGYSDPRAEKLAEETGIAFQLTNILRDVAEDAARNRVYLPLEDLAAHGVSLDSLLASRAGCAAHDADERALLAAVAQRALKITTPLRASCFRSSTPKAVPRCGCWFPFITPCSSALSGATTTSFRAAPSVPTACKKSPSSAVGLARMAWARIVT